MIYKWYYAIRPNFIYHGLNFFKNTPLFYLLSSIFSLFFIFKNFNFFLPKNKFYHFNHCFNLISPFYWVRYLNITKYGLRGFSPTLGLGKHSLSNYWVYNLSSQFLFYKLGIWFYILSFIVLFLILSIILFLTQFKLIIIFSYVLLFLSSKIIHKFIFVCQNYNALGWAFCPIFLYALQSQEYFYAGLSLLLISYLSLTAIVLILPFSLCYCLEYNSHVPLLTTIPTIFKLFLSILYSSGIKNIAKSSLFILKSIGFTKINTKYILKRDPFKSKYILFFYITFIIYNFFEYNYINIFFITFLLLVFINYYLFRFCDEQSFDILSFILLFNYTIMQSPINFIDFFFITFLLNFSFIELYDHRLIKRPISAKPMLNAFDSFFKPIKENSRVFFCFTDPQNKYEDLFNHQRYLLDFPSFCATLRNIHLFPEYSTVFDTNYPNSPNIWADNPKDTEVLLEEYNTPYCIVSQSTESDLSKEWLNAGFSIVNSFDWGIFLNENKIDRNLWWFGMPKWFLLKKA